MRRAFLILVLLAGCATRPVPQPKVVCWSKNLAYCKGMWQREAQRRFKDPFIIICHGGGRIWEMSPDLPRRRIEVEDVVQVLCDVYPKRPIVIISCNHEGATLHAPRSNVWYSKKIVSAVPRSTPIIGYIFPMDWDSDIFNFVEAEYPVDSLKK